MTIGKSVLVAAVLVLSGCAHAAPGSPADPAEAALVRLEAVVSAQGDVECAAQAVEGLSRRLAPQTDVLKRPEFIDGQRRYLAWKVGTLELSQAAAIQARLMGDVLQASEAVQKGTPGAAAWVSGAMVRYTAFSDALLQAPWAGSGEDEAVAAAQFASVWGAYFCAPEKSEDRAAFLDWLTDRSLQDPSLLRAYQAEFDKALQTKCR